MARQTTLSQPTVKIVGTNGQISLGKRYAGRQVLVEQSEPGVWIVRTATVIPDNERWLHQPQVAEDLQNALKWATDHEAQESDTEHLRQNVSHD
ncbi:MAG TPA: hypothetical protein VKN62_04440 [Pelovirga sp.]|nr:hypothetical protein [Pelovirga sp.]